MALRTALVIAASAAAGCAQGQSVPGSDSTPDAAPTDAAPTDATATGSDAPTSSCTMPFTGPLANWSFSGEAGNQAATAVASKAPGVVASAVTRAAALTAVSGASSINSSNWPTGAQLDATKYYAVTLTPPAGCTLTLTQANVDAKASGTGPASASVATSADAFAATTAVSTAAPAVAALAVTNATGTVEVRIYGFAATATGGTLRLQTTLTLDGAIR